MVGEDRLRGPWPWWLPVGLALDALALGAVEATKQGAGRVVLWVLIAVAFLVVLPVSARRGAARRGVDWPPPGTIVKAVSALAVLSGAVSALMLAILM